MWTADWLDTSPQAGTVVADNVSGKSARSQRLARRLKGQRAEVSRVRGPASQGEPARAAPGSEPLLWAAVAVGAALVIYARALSRGFIWDDPLVLQQLRAIQSLRDLLLPPPIIPKFYFRPLVFASYLFDRALGGETPFWFHASVLVFHVINVVLVFVLARRLLAEEPLIAAGGALLFAVFPTHVESVAWMAGRSDVIVCTFVLLTILLFLDRRRPWAAWLGGVTFLLGALTKELALACLALVPVFDLLSTRRLHWRRYVPLAIAAVVYFALRRQALGTFVGGMAATAAVPQLTNDVVRAVGFYVLEAVIPLELCAYIPVVPTAAGYLLTGLLALVLGGALIVLAWRRGRWPLAFLVAWFFVTLAPSLTVIVRRSASAPVADRYLYVPSVASCLLLAWAVVQLTRRLRLSERWAATALALLGCILGVQALLYTRVWADDLSFWSDVAGKVQNDALPHRELATALLNRNRVDEADRELQRALAAPSDTVGQAMTYNQLGNLYRRLGRYQEAEQAFETAIRLQPHPTLFHNLGMALMMHLEEEQRQGDQPAMRRDIVRARDAFEQALRLGNLPGAAQGFPQWDAAKTHALLGQVLFSMGQRDAAREHLEIALHLEPTGSVAEVTRQYLRKLQ
jgi:tetratricopeptide (TPR) repeat protein